MSNIKAKPMPKKIRVFVSRFDVSKGIKRSTINCPLANVVKRNYKDYHVSIGFGITLRYKHNYSIHYTISKKSIQKIKDFDNGKKFPCGWIEATLEE